MNIVGITSRDRVLRTLKHEPVDRAPRDLWVSPAIGMLRADELAEMQVRYPSDFVQPEVQYPKGHRAKGSPHEPGLFTDAWGCGWRVAERGAAGELVHSPLAEPSHLSHFHPPLDLLEKFDRASVSRQCAATSRFVLARTETRPFDRLQFLRGPQAARTELLRNTQSIRNLLGKLHDFSLREMELWAATDVDGVAFRDDWGSPDGLLVPQDLWDEMFKPLYRQYCEILRARDKFVFFQSAGRIDEILDDLIEIGVDAVHASVREKNLAQLTERFRTRITFWGRTEHQQLVRGKPAEIAAAVHHIRAALDYGRGGLIAQCEWNADVPFENVASLLEAWHAPIPAHAHAEKAPGG